MNARKRKTESSSAPLKLDSRSLYEACADVLTREISQGVLKPGQRLASERALAEALGFTRLTARRALMELGNRGLLEPDERRGWQVRGGPVSEPLNALIGFSQMARQRGLTATSRVLSLDYCDATIDESETLRVGARGALARSVAIAPARRSSHGDRALENADCSSRAVAA